jgi:hypothetical protein
MNLGEMLRAKLMMTQYTDATTPKEEVQHEAPKLETKRKPFQIGNNLNRTLFEQAQLYPTTRKNLTARMVAMGFKAASVSSILGQMMRQGLLQADDEGVLHLTVGQYTPIKSAKMLRKMEAAKAKAKAKHKQIKVSVRNRTVEEVREERPVSSSPMPVAPPEGIPRVDALLRSLSILEAQELYAALKDIFGDNK